MTHSVEKHLSTTPSAYDDDIPRFVPGYEAMLDQIIVALTDLVRPDARIIDLGAGTGALSERIAKKLPSVRLLLLDADPAMLAQAEIRLADHRARLELRAGSFTDPLPPCDAAVASLSLHHLRTIEVKREGFRNIFSSLPEGGVLVNGDATVPASRSLSDPIFRRWASHLISYGDTEAEAFARFAKWQEEDRYFGVEEELDMLRAAGFSEVDVRWKLEAATVIVAKK